VDGQLAAWITGIGAILFATAGVALSIREVRRKERKDALRIISHMEHVVLDQQNEAIAWRQYVFTLRRILADHGIPSPDPPALAEYTDVESRSLLPDSPDAGRRDSRFRRKRGRREPDADHRDDDGDGSFPGAAG